MGKSILGLATMIGVASISICGCNKAAGDPNVWQDHIARADDPVDDQSLYVRAADVIVRHRGLSGSATEPFDGTFRTAKGMAPLVIRCAEQDGWTAFTQTTEAPAANAVIETGLGTFVVGGTKGSPFVLHRFAVRIGDGACAIMSRYSAATGFVLTGDRAPAAVLLAADAIELPRISGLPADAESSDGTSRALGVLASYASPAARADTYALNDRVGKHPQTSVQPPSAAHQFGIFEYEKDGLKLGVEVREGAVGLMVVNSSIDKITIDPQRVVILTTRGAYSPSTMHSLSLGGYGSPLQPFAIGPKERRGFILSGFCSPQDCARNPLGPAAAPTPRGGVLRIEVDGRILRFAGE